MTNEPVSLLGDRLRLLEVFQNLLDNAGKFSSTTPAARIEVLVQQMDQELVISVHDNGMGIDARHQHKLFGLFEKLHPEMEGTGVGLALVKRIIDVHGFRLAYPARGGVASGRCPW